ncbi:MAG: alanine racemase [Actinomycetota bacterium]
MTSVRPVWAEVDLGAVRHNTARLAAQARPAVLCAVVKAHAYGHGPVPVSKAVLEAGATWLAVALVEEGAVLRDAGIEAPVLLLSEPPPEAMDEVVALGLTPTVYTAEGLEALAAAAARWRPASAPGKERRPLAVHVKVDTGMHRVGAAPADAVKLGLAVRDRPELDLEGLWTHLATADAPDNPFTSEQLGRFAATLDELSEVAGRPRLVHACNSAAMLTRPEGHHDMVRCGITIYGQAPSPVLAPALGLRPVLSLRARVSQVKEVAPNEGISYGLRYRPAHTATVATVPIGYADGVPWRLGVTGGEVLIGGRRRPIAGAVTMDQVLVDCGDDRGVRPGDDVVLLGAQGGESIGPWEWAERVGTIAYDVLCGIGPRVPRTYLG